MKLLESDIKKLYKKHMEEITGEKQELVFPSGCVYLPNEKEFRFDYKKHNTKYKLFHSFLAKQKDLYVGDFHPLTKNNISWDDILNVGRFICFKKGSEEETKQEVERIELYRELQMQQLLFREYTKGLKTKIPYDNLTKLRSFNAGLHDLIKSVA